MAFTNSGKRRKAAEQRSQSLLSMAGYPLTTAPAGTSFGIPD
jgi:hypothetical protein